MASPIFDFNAMDRGNVAPGSESNLAVGALVGAWRDVTGADNRFEYTVLSPAKQIDGTTAATGTVVLKLDFGDDGSTVQESWTSPSLVSDDVYTYRPGIGRSRKFYRATLTVTGVVGHIVAGPTMGGTRINRAH